MVVYWMARFCHHQSPYTGLNNYIKLLSALILSQSLHSYYQSIDYSFSVNNGWSIITALTSGCYFQISTPSCGVWTQPKSMWNFWGLNWLLYGICIQFNHCIVLNWWLTSGYERFLSARDGDEFWLIWIMTMNIEDFTVSHTEVSSSNRTG